MRSPRPRRMVPTVHELLQNPPIKGYLGVAHGGISAFSDRVGGRRSVGAHHTPAAPRSRYPADDLGAVHRCWRRPPSHRIRVYHLAGASEPDHLELRAAWLRLAPGTSAWERGPEDGVVSHRSAAEMYGLGHLPADVHDFTVGRRRQSRQEGVRLHTRRLDAREWIVLRGLPVTRPARIASDLLHGREEPEAVAHVIADSLRAAYDYPVKFAGALAVHAHRFGLRRHDGLGLLQWLLGLVGDSETNSWMEGARTRWEGTTETERPPKPRSREGVSP